MLAFLPLPDGTTQDVLAIVVVCLGLTTLAWFVLPDAVRNLFARLNRQYASDSDSPWEGSPFAWMMDLGIWFVLTVGSAAYVAVFASPFLSDSPEASSSFVRYAAIVAALVCYSVQAICTSFGGTVGERALGVRMVMQDTFEPLSLWYSALRTLLVTSPFLAFFVLVSLDSAFTIDDEMTLYDITAHAAIVLLLLGLIVWAISVSLIRSEHPHGQSLTDLTMRTIRVPNESVGNPCTCARTT